MIREQFRLCLDNEIIVDNFAGGGGASTGLELGLGRHVDIAINHDAEAIAMHAANHPQTEHYIEDVFAVDPRTATRGRPVGLVWLSPDCKHHSKAKGGKPREKKIRGLAWIGAKWAGQTAARVMMLENVEEFQDWGPLVAKRCKDTGRVVTLDEMTCPTTGRTINRVAEPGEVVPLSRQHLVPCPRRKGQHFRQFVAHLRRLGYAVEWRELRACDYGAPTTRKRLFLIARNDGRPIVWPAPTHGDPRSEMTRLNKLKPWRTAAECIDWSLPCKSIFGRSKPLAEATLRRIARGIARYVLEADKPFIVPVGEIAAAPFITEHANASCQRNFSAAEPLRTLCAEVKGGHFALTTATLVQAGYGERAGQAPRALDIEAPLGTVVAGGVKHALACATLIKHYGGNYTGPGSDLTEPMHTVTATDHHSLVASHLVKLQQNSVGQSLDEPMHTVMAGATRFGEVRAFLVKYYGEGGQWQSLNEPMHTIPTKDRMGLVTVQIDGETYAIADIGMRMLEPPELYAAQSFPSHYRTVIEHNGKPLPKHARVRMCGNSVPPVLPAALARANCMDLAAWSETELKQEKRMAA